MSPYVRSKPIAQRMSRSAHAWPTSVAKRQKCRMCNENKARTLTIMGASNDCLDHVWQFLSGKLAKIISTCSIGMARPDGDI